MNINVIVVAKKLNFWKDPEVKQQKNARSAAAETFRGNCRYSRLGSNRDSQKNVMAVRIFPARMRMLKAQIYARKARCIWK